MNEAQIKRSDITGFTWHILNMYIEFVFGRGKLVTIAANYKTLKGKTYYIYDRFLNFRGQKKKRGQIR